MYTGKLGSGAGDGRQKEPWETAGIVARAESLVSYRNEPIIGINKREAFLLEIYLWE